MAAHSLAEILRKFQPLKMPIKLKSSEGTEFFVERDIAEKSVVLKNLLGDLGESEVSLVSSYG